MKTSPIIIQTLIIKTTYMGGIAQEETLTQKMYMFPQN